MENTKILIGILLVAIIGIGFVTAHRINPSEEKKITNNMMTKERMHMIGDMDMMHNSMDVMMNNEELRKEMIEHMKTCPMMRSSLNE